MAEKDFKCKNIHLENEFYEVAFFFIQKCRHFLLRAISFLHCTNPHKANYNLSWASKDAVSKTICKI